MEGSVSIRERIEGVFDSLRPSERQVASHVLAQFDDVSAMTIADLAGAAGVSQPTVIRFSRALGFSGYREFRYALSHADDGIGFDPLTGFNLLPWDHVAAVPGKVVDRGKSMLDDLFRSLSDADYTASVRTLAAANAIDIYGVANALVPAADLFQKLTYLGLDCRLHTDAQLQQVGAGHLNAHDAAVAFSYSGTDPQTVRALAQAHATGAFAIAVTNVVGSPLCAQADAVLLAGSGTGNANGEQTDPAVDHASGMAHVVASYVTHGAIVDMLYLGLIAHDHARFTAALATSAGQHVEP